VSTWPAIEADLRRELLQAGRCEIEIDNMLAALAPVVLAVERAGTHVDSDIAWALLAVETDRRRR
jgi:hypothetical protein